MAHKILPPKTEAKDIDNWLNISGKKIVFYHGDTDGICSAALILKFFPGFESIPLHGPHIDRKLFREIIKKRPDLLLFVDIPIDQEWEKLKKIKEKLTKIKILIIDHHILLKNLNSRNIIHINPRFYKDVYISASYVVYRLLELMGKPVKNFIWIAVTGAIGDYDLSSSYDIIKECDERFPGLVGKNPLKGKLGYISEIMYSAVSLNDLKGAEKVLKILLKAKTYKDFLNSRSIKTWHRKVKEEIRRVVKYAERHAEEYPELKLKIYTIKTRMNLVSTISTIFGERYPDCLVVVNKKTDKEWKVSFRNQSGTINTGEIAKKCSKGIGMGGGHKKAAGCIVKDWEKFKKKLLKEVKLILKQKIN
ncbi:MAG: hypothetical protein DRP18_00685 [Candidatus Aenigmatarchaeota archaeon]|nr:MAG: hypothetical protein DRP18_00685 [Candidatus Aenigmarchaeota archaeon]RLJ07965.1 MAG: hypothetical protein DRP16_02370 [Candidatus Aenigmarchaeota archaeon]